MVLKCQGVGGLNSFWLPVTKTSLKQLASFLAASKPLAKGDSLGGSSHALRSRCWGLAKMQHHAFCKPSRLWMGFVKMWDGFMIFVAYLQSQTHRVEVVQAVERTMPKWWQLSIYRGKQHIRSRFQRSETRCKESGNSKRHKELKTLWQLVKPHVTWYVMRTPRNRPLGHEYWTLAKNSKMPSYQACEIKMWQGNPASFRINAQLISPAVKVTGLMYCSLRVYMFGPYFGSAFSLISPSFKARCTSSRKNSKS